ncbi:cardiac phospholamban isoform X2 [Melospiza melodia melodia]|uniref:cardiac phospholamban isoform X2 n=1 Tax=Melospiza melodia melodia TaxID=1914991 RepID=UPI002FD2740A
MQPPRFPHPVIEQVVSLAHRSPHKRKGAAHAAHVNTFLLGTSSEQPLPVSEGKWDQSTSWSQTRKSCQRSAGTSHSPEQAPLCFTKSHQGWVTVPWRINKQAPQRLSKTKRRY